jgi:SAM-dependent methyltransferase
MSLGADHMISQDIIKERYQGEQGRSYHSSIHAIPESAYPWLVTTRCEKLCDHICREDVVLEYGVGMGWNLAGLECKKRLGFDLSEHLENILTGHGIEFVRDFSNISDQSISVVICHHVLEHVANPGEVLRQIKRVLIVNGKLLLFVPYEKERRYRHYRPQEPNHHLYSWNVQTLGNLVKDMGLEIVEGQLGRFGYDRFSAVWAHRWRLGESGFRVIRGFLQLIRPAFEVRVVAYKVGS